MLGGFGVGERAFSSDENREENSEGPNFGRRSLISFTSKDLGGGEGL
jgi:hypothetical protein